MRLPTLSRVTAHHVTRHNLSSQAQSAVLPEKFSFFVDDLENPKMKQNITFQALKPFIPPENCQLYAENLTQDVAKACDSEEGESNPPGEGQEEGQEIMPMSFAACHEIIIVQPETPIYTYIFPIDCSKMYDQTGIVRDGDQIYDQKSVCLVCTYPGGDSRQCTHSEIYIEMGNTKDPMKSCVKRLKLSDAKESKKEILKSSSPTQKPKSHTLDLWKKPYKDGSIQRNDLGEMLVPLSHHIIQALETEKGQLQQMQTQSALPKKANPVSPRLLLLLLLIFTKYGSHYQIW